MAEAKRIIETMSSPILDQLFFDVRTAIIAVATIHKTTNSSVLTLIFIGG
jgi:hypothetical protein